MAGNKIIAILGATGAQGGSLVNAILNNPSSEFSVRAIVRDVNSDKAKALVQRGAQVVPGDVGDQKSLARAFEGAYGIYAVTFYWAHMKPDQEIAEIERIANAARTANPRHIIWSTLEDTRRQIPLADNRMPTLMGKYKVPHFDAKGSADHFFTDLGLPTTFFYISFYWENMIFFGQGPKPGPDGVLQLSLPMAEKKLAGIGVEDIGKCALGVFKAGETYIGKEVGIAGDQCTGREMARAMTKVLGREVQYTPISAETYRGFGFPGADDMGNMYQYYAEFEEYLAPRRSVELARKLNPELQSFEEWLRRNATRIPLT